METDKHLSKLVKEAREGREPEFEPSDPLRIDVWSFHDAPEALRKLSPHGGDEDWLAFIPAGFIAKHGEWIPWADEGGPFGCCDVSEHRIEHDGQFYGQVRIGAHS